jgi:asparagine synthase (glutamine-hydrolysing)
MSAYLLTSQGDRVTMGHSVEARYPYLDPDVIDFCTALPGRFKLRGLLDKVILRNLASRELPPEVWQRPKQPYRAPIGRVLFSRGTPDYVRDLLSAGELQRYGLVDVGPATRLVERAFAQDGAMGGEREEMALVGLLTLQLLARHYLTDFAARVRVQLNRLGAREPAVRIDRLIDTQDFPRSSRARATA